MKILGIGVDIINNKRLKKLIKNKNFLKRLFTHEEIKNSKFSKNKTSYYSKKFAAKESFSKALGSGFRNGLNFKDIEILNDNLGKPYYVKSTKITDLVFKKFKIKRYNLFLSISDEKDYSVAFTIIQTI